MRGLLLICLLLPLSLTAGVTNQWEHAGDATVGLDAAQKYRRAVKEYAESTHYLGRHQDVRRSYEKVRWHWIGSTNFCGLVRNSLHPYFQDNYPTTAASQQFKERVVTKYRLLKRSADEIVMPEVPGFVNNVVSVPVLDVDINTIPFFVVESDTTIDYTVIPETAVILVRADLSVVDEITSRQASYSDAYEIFDDGDLYYPHPNSPLGHKYKAMMTRFYEYGDWSENPELVAEWTAFWWDVEHALDRRRWMEARR